MQGRIEFFLAEHTLDTNQDTNHLDDPRQPLHGQPHAIDAAPEPRTRSLLRQDDFDRLVANYRNDHALATPAAPVRNGLAKLATAAEAYRDALAALPPAGRVLASRWVKDVDAEVTAVGVVSTGSGAVAADLTARMSGGGRRTVLQVMGQGSPNERLLRSAKSAR